MAYQVIARKWRPQGFDEVTGQEVITQTLRNAIEHAVVMGEGERVEEDDLPLSIRQWAQGGPASPLSAPVSSAQPPAGTLEAMEVKALQEALAKTGGNQTRAARLLGITRRTLGYRMKKYGIPSGREDDDIPARPLPPIQMLESGEMS